MITHLIPHIILFGTLVVIYLFDSMRKKGKNQRVEPRPKSKVREQAGDKKSVTTDQNLPSTSGNNPHRNDLPNQTPAGVVNSNKGPESQNLSEGQGLEVASCEHFLTGCVYGVSCRNRHQYSEVDRETIALMLDMCITSLSRIQISLDRLDARVERVEQSLNNAEVVPPVNFRSRSRGRMQRDLREVRSKSQTDLNSRASDAERDSTYKKKKY
uniref:C3H1-type domain-containing protein n=1 Tax=Crocidura lasiura lispivirus 2 TaxID=3139472 RepID=A0AB38ZJP8_9MONO